MILSVEEVAARLDWMGLRLGHKYIKTLSCCGAGLGEFDPGSNEINLDFVLNDKFPHTFARNLAKELGQKRTWKNKAYSAHPRIRVGGYPGFIDCKVKKDKLVSLAIEKRQRRSGCSDREGTIKKCVGSDTAIRNRRGVRGSRLERGF
jgi:hypothetical protein